MSINFTITAGSAGELVDEIRALAGLLTPAHPKLSGAEIEEIKARGPGPIVEVVAETAKPRSRKKTETIIEHDPKEVKTDAAVGTDASEGAGRADEGGVSESADVGTDGEGVAAPEVEATAEVDDVAGTAEPNEPTLTIDELRLFTIGQYLNVVFDGAEARKNAFGALLAEFDVKALKDLPSAKINAFKALVDTRIAEAVKN